VEHSLCRLIHRTVEYAKEKLKENPIERERERRQTEKREREMERVRVREEMEGKSLA
jgi:hypothetical protein